MLHAGAIKYRQFYMALCISSAVSLFMYGTNTVAAISGAMKDDKPIYILPSCPNSPNCVSSESSDLDHQVLPLKIETLPAEQAMFILKQTLSGMAGQVNESHQSTHLHAQFKSNVFGFIDDVDVVLNRENRRIEIRSASRTGYYDFGVNKKRVETIRDAFNQEVRKVTGKH